MEVWVAALVFLGTYALIATERLHKTVAALLGGLLMIVFGVLDQEAAFEAIDFNVIFLLLGMMVIANVMRKTGVFQWLAIRAVQLARGDPWWILVVLCVITAVASAFLDNVTTVVLIAPITLYVAATLGVSPVPYLIAEILASNIGGTATLIGDPPNILIGSAAGVDFPTFAANMTPPALLAFGSFLLLARFLFGRELSRQEVAVSVADLDASGAIADPRLMRISVLVMLATIAGFLVAAPLGYEPATVALLGATAIFVLTREDPADILADVEWSTLLFFVGLFVVVEGVIHVGIIRAFADGLFELTGGDLTVTSLALMWVSGAASGIVDNIPYTATLIPVVQQLGERGVEVAPLWWSLALGADLGGNATIIGASANVIIASLAARTGHPISFSSYLRYGIPTVVVSLSVASLWIWLVHLR
ncbi:MAG TPA: ArsB/NhaD family transporter [Candidatus Limnocylindrales bacterium]|nr:ArsB/NhaD family transporter [Candidatus Limnocylindrales bacterium]